MRDAAIKLLSCRVCGCLAPEEAFYPGQVRADKTAGECKECTKRRVRTRARTNPKVQEYDRLRAKGEKVRARIAKVAADWNAKYPDAYKAHAMVGNAVRSGALVREPCLFCGHEKVHAHHRDYSRPLDVIWLCAKCHHRLHAAFPETAAHERKPNS